MSNSVFQPRLFTLIARRQYSFRKFQADLMAGIITGIVAVPLAIAFGIASGTTPAQGLYTAVIAGFLISFFSGSSVQIGGPTGAFIVVICGVIQTLGLQGLTIATIMAGGIMILMGALRLGQVIRYIPYPVTVGFTAGIAVIIAVSQLKDMFGLTVADLPEGVFSKLYYFVCHYRDIHVIDFAMGACAFTVIRLWPQKWRRIPASLIVLVAATALVAGLEMPVATIGSRFGSLPTGFPDFSLPLVSLAELPRYVPAAISIALLGSIESLLSCVVADGMTGERHHSNTELIGQGIANIVAPLFGGIPATGAIARTATNIRNGGRTPIAGLVHAGTLLLLVLCFGHLVLLIPMAVLSGILLNVAVNMSEFHLIAKMFRSPKSDLLIFMLTFSLTVLIDLVVAIQAGMVLAAFLFMRRMEAVSGAGLLRSDEEEGSKEDRFALSNFSVPSDVAVFEIYGPFFFGATAKFQEELRLIGKLPRVLILRMRNVPAIDATGLLALEEVIEQCWKDKCRLLLSGVHSQPRRAMEKAGLLQKLGEDSIFDNIGEAIAAAERGNAEN